MARKKTKRCNGAGESVTVTFDTSDPVEAAALAMAQLLASKHGRRKDVIVALLAAMQERLMQTGELLTPTAISNALTGITPLVLNYEYVAPTLDVPSSKRRSSRTQLSNAPQITVTETRSTKATAQQAASNFLSSVSNFFD